MLIIRRLNCIDAAPGIVLSVSGRSMHRLRENDRMITFDIKDLYVNTPIDETLNIIKTKLFQNNNTQISHQILSLLRVVLSQNYFTSPPPKKKIYQPDQGVSMRSPISGLTAEIFLQHYEDANIRVLSQPVHRTATD